MGESAYDILDRYLRNNLGDDDYAEYSIALEELAFDAARYRFLASRNLMDNGKEPTPALLKAFTDGVDLAMKGSK